MNGLERDTNIMNGIRPVLPKTPNMLGNNELREKLVAIYERCTITDPKMRWNTSQIKLTLKKDVVTYLGDTKNQTNKQQSPQK